jgi:hypothetical protein
MKKSDFENRMTSIDNEFEEAESKELSIIDEKFDEAKQLFMKIYDEYITSDGFKVYLEKLEEYKIESAKRSKSYSEELEEWKENRQLGAQYPVFFSYHFPEDFSADCQKFNMKIELLKKYLSVSKFPSEWYYHDKCKIYIGI